MKLPRILKQFQAKVLTLWLRFFIVYQKRYLLVKISVFFIPKFIFWLQYHISIFVKLNFSDGLEINGARMHVMVNILNRISHMVRTALDKLGDGKKF